MAERSSRRPGGSADEGSRPRAADSDNPLSNSGKPLNDTDTVPDGGILAWLQVLGSFFLSFNTFGLVNILGIYQTYYQSGDLFVASAPAISWIGSLQAFLLQFLGPLAGPIYYAGLFRPLIVTGSLLVVFGQMMLSLCTECYQVLLAQALCVGIGAGLLWLPCVAILSQYFDRHLATATGISATGSGLGGIILPIVFYRLLPQIGFAWATRVLGFIALATLSVSIIVMKPRVKPSARRQLVDLTAFKEVLYALFTMGCFFAWLGLYGPFFYVDSFSLFYDIGSTAISFYTLAIISTGSVLGCLIPNFLADHIGPMNMFAPTTIVAGVLAFCLIPVRHLAPLLIDSTLYGFCVGAITSLFSMVYIRLSLHRRGLIGTRMGMGLLITSFAVLVGTPICGWILDASNYTFLWLFSGLTILLGGFLMSAARLTRTHGGLLVKA